MAEEARLTRSRHNIVPVIRAQSTQLAAQQLQGVWYGGSGGSAMMGVGFSGLCAGRNARDVPYSTRNKCPAYDAPRLRFNTPYGGINQCTYIRPQTTAVHSSSSLPLAAGTLSGSFFISIPSPVFVFWGARDLPNSPGSLVPK